MNEWLLEGLGVLAGRPNVRQNYCSLERGEEVANMEETYNLSRGQMGRRAALPRQGGGVCLPLARSLPPVQV